MLEVEELTTCLVGFNTVSQNTNHRMADFLDSILSDLGFSVQLYPKNCCEKTPNGNDKSVTKYGIVARIGPRDVEPLMLSAHMDTVPVGEEDKWLTHPFTLTQKGGRLHGLGSSDMKGPLAALICAVEPLAKRAVSLKREIVFCLSFDEEVGLLGARYLLKAADLKAKYILVAEPTLLVPVRLHKGYMQLRAVCHGQSAHGSNPDAGVNAIEIAAKVIAVLHDFAEELKISRQPLIRPSYATLNIGAIKGGEKLNVVPDICRIEFEIRPIPGQSTQTIKEDLAGRMEQIGWNDDNSPKVTLELVNRTKAPTEPVYTPSDSLFVKTVEAVSGKPSTGVAYCTDASILQGTGAECLIIGPGDIAVAHQPNEFILQSQLLMAVDQFREIVKAMCF
ncbi:MAG: M20 family metallopeptidase [Candidatus Pacebacteria bacterium]|nr:M20 family metallopeptidase [Candidatus Paceibacterota bacterium]